jgi:hypothetical protein
MSQPLSQKEYERRIDAISVCGKNRGPHDYIPVAFAKDTNAEYVTMFICRTCFVRVSTQTLYEHFPEVKV